MKFLLILTREQTGDSVVPLEAETLDQAITRYFWPAGEGSLGLFADTDNPVIRAVAYTVGEPAALDIPTMRQDTFKELDNKADIHEMLGRRRAAQIALTEQEANVTNDIAALHAALATFEPVQK